MNVTGRRAIRHAVRAGRESSPCCRPGRRQPVFAADPPADPLEGPFVDVGLVETTGPDATSDAPPRLLVVRATDPSATASILLELLGADGAGWAVLDKLTVTTGLSEPSRPMLVPTQRTLRTDRL